MITIIHAGREGLGGVVELNYAASPTGNPELVDGAIPYYTIHGNVFLIRYTVWNGGFSRPSSRLTLSDGSEPRAVRLN